MCLYRYQYEKEEGDKKKKKGQNLNVKVYYCSLKSHCTKALCCMLFFCERVFVS